jgi:DNA repair exonuclease SbcCD ATPase subunit
MSTILDEAMELCKSVRTLEQEISFRRSKINDCVSNMDLLSLKLSTILSAEEYHKKAIDLLYNSSLKELETLANDVIGAIFFDRNYRIKMELADSRSKALDWYLIDDDLGGVQMSVKDDVGRGLRAVLSFTIQSYYVLSLGTKYLFIDEGYSYISEAYIDKFLELVKTLSEKKGLSLVMISHDDRFNGFADKRYRVLNGRISDSTESDMNNFQDWLEATGN